MTAAPLADAYARHGYVAVPGLLADEVSALLAAVVALDAETPDTNELSLGAMRFHSNLYRLLPEVVALLRSPPMVALVTALAGPDLWCRWDQAVRKGPGSGAFPWHQDNGYTQLRAEHLQVWVALTDAPPERGGLWVEPGGHHDRERAHEWMGQHASLVDAPVDTEPLAAQAGDVIAFSSFLPHFTGPNSTPEDRWVYVAEFLPLGVDDPTVDAPHLVIARDGRPEAGP